MSFSQESAEKEQELIQQLQGSPQQFEKTTTLLFQRYSKYLPTLGKRFPSLSKEELQSAYHDAFQALIKMIVQKSFDSKKGSMGTLLFEIFNKKCIDQLRKNTNQRNEWAKQLQELVPNLPGASVEFLSEIINRDTFRQVVSTMDDLKPPCKQLILDLDYWGFSPEETAQRNGYKNGHSASQAKYRCIKALQKKIRMKKNGGS